MNRYEKFEMIIRELELAATGIRKNWTSESAGVFCSSFDDSVRYIRKMTESLKDDPSMNEQETKSVFSDFSF